MLYEFANVQQKQIEIFTQLIEKNFENLEVEV